MVTFLRWAIVVGMVLFTIGLIITIALDSYHQDHK
jgi:hypothetical protein